MLAPSEVKYSYTTIAVNTGQKKIYKTLRGDEVARVVKELITKGYTVDFDLNEVDRDE